MLPWLHAVPEGERRGERIGSGRRGEVIGVREVGRGRGRKEGREDRKRIGRVELEERRGRDKYMVMRSVNDNSLYRVHQTTCS